MKQNKMFVTASLLLYCSLACTGQPLPFAAGFRAVEILDDTRNFNPDSSGAFEPRPVILYVWYPARKAGSGPKSVTFNDLIAPAGLSENEELLKFKTLVTDYPYTDSAQAEQVYERARTTPTASVRDAAPARGRFPVVLFGTGMSAGGYFYFRQCERLAQAGFVAVVPVSQGLRRGLRAGFDQQGIELQFRDLELAFRTAGGWLFADTVATGLAAWSVGGLAAATLQSRHPSVRAVLSLDAATGYAYGEELLAASSFFKAENTRVPYLHVHGSVASRAAKNFTYFERIHRGPRCLALLEGADHFHFTSVACFLNDLTVRDPAVRTRFDWLNNLTQTYFDLHLKKRQAAKRRLERLFSEIKTNCF